MTQAYKLTGRGLRAVVWVRGRHIGSMGLFDYWELPIVQVRKNLHGRVMLYRTHCRDDRVKTARPASFLRY